MGPWFDLKQTASATFLVTLELTLSMGGMKVPPAKGPDGERRYDQ
jgi:hypothetical protein